MEKTDKIFFRETEKSLEELKFGSATAPSEKHPDRNEDSLIGRSDLGLFAILDGVGGHYGGKEASNLAAAALDNFFELKNQDPNLSQIGPEEWMSVVRGAFLAARAELDKFIADKQLQQNKPDTTASVVKTFERGGKSYAVYGSLGDSRICKFSADGELTDLTEDDDMLREFKGMSEDDKKEIRIRLSEITKDEDLDEVIGGMSLRVLFGLRNVITNSLGKFKSAGEIQTGYVELSPGEKIVIISDGVHDVETKNEMKEIIAKAKTPEDAAKALVAAAKATYLPDGSKKNIRAKKDDRTAIVLGRN